MSLFADGSRLRRPLDLYSQPCAVLFMRFETVFVTLFSVATAVALLARWLKAP